MASTSIHAPKARRLRELLEEQQEPFVLDVYLLERGHSKKIRDSDTSKDGWINSVLKNRERSPKRSKRMKSILARVFFGKASGGSNYDRKACNVERFGDFGIGSDMGRETQVEELHQLSSASFCNADMEREIEVAEIDRFSSASYTTLFDSSSEGNMEEFSSTKHNPFPSTDSFGVLKLNTMKDKVRTTLLFLSPLYYASIQFIWKFMDLVANKSSRFLQMEDTNPLKTLSNSVLFQY